MNGLRRIREEDDGSTLILTIFYAALCLLVILLVVAATALYLDRKRLYTLADGAALAGAEAFELESATLEGDRLDINLNQADVAAAATEYLAQAPGGSLEDLALESASASDGQSATVTVTAWWRPPVLTLLIPSGLPLEVTATARSVLLR